ncbi:MAG: efflux RND transporter periplasmic adaptor subunit, partial [Actinobacteria bacterium]|nr:efflux RND transporter periplasmic adaptor subunit [Actinomycetota bacterium]
MNMATTSNKKKMGMIFLVVLITLGLIAYWIYSRSIVSTSDAHVDSHIYYMSPKVGGLIKKVYVNNFYNVKKGQLLVKIDPIDYINQLKSLKHQYSATENTISSLEQKILAIQTGSTAQISTFQNNINAEKALLNSYNVNLHKAYLDLKRYENLYSHAVISKNRLEIENQQYHAALSKVQAQQKAIAATSSQISGVLSYKNQITGIYAEIAAYNNKLKSLKNQINIAKNNLKHTNIIAPVDGIITQKNIEPGQYVQPGQMLLIVVPLKPAWINANFKETRMYKIK